MYVYIYSVCVIITVTFVLCKLPNVSTDSAQFPSRLQTFVQYVVRNLGPRYSKLLNAHTGCALLGHDVASLSNKLQKFQRNILLSKRREPITLRRSVISKKKRAVVQAHRCDNRNNCIHKAEKIRVELIHTKTPCPVYFRTALWVSET